MSIDARPAGRSLVVVLAVGGVVLAWLVLLPRIFRRNRDLLVRIGPFKRFLTGYNNLTRNISGNGALVMVFFRPTWTPQRARLPDLARHESLP